MGFYRDPFAVVHLRGYINGCDEGDVAFSLPVGFRPQADELFAALKNNSQTSMVEVETDGEVRIYSGENATLSGIELRTR